MKRGFTRKGYAAYGQPHLINIVSTSLSAGRTGQITQQGTKVPKEIGDVPVHDHVWVGRVGNDAERVSELVLAEIACQMRSSLRACG